MALYCIHVYICEMNRDETNAMSSPVHKESYL